MSRSQGLCVACGRPIRRDQTYRSCSQCPPAYRFHETCRCDQHPDAEMVAPRATAVRRDPPPRREGAHLPERGRRTVVRTPNGERRARAAAARTPAARRAGGVGASSLPALPRMPVLAPARRLSKAPAYTWIGSGGLLLLALLGVSGVIPMAGGVAALVLVVAIALAIYGLTR